MHSRTTMQMLGQTISGRYRILEKIGEGFISVVYSAEDVHHDNRIVAIKSLKKKNTSDRIEDIIRFYSEASIVSKMSDPTIVKIYEVGEFRDNHYISMEYIPGSSLYSLLKNGLTFDIDDAVEIVKKICDALSHIHDKRIIHRDLKPGNIMVTSTDKGPEVKVIDFGLSQVKDLAVITGDEEVVGTFSYMSPEQAGVIKTGVDERSDLYSLGVIMYQLLTGRLPFTGDSISAIIHQHIAKIPPAPSEVNDRLPGILDRIILKLLEKEPEKRYQSARGTPAGPGEVPAGRFLLRAGLGRPVHQAELPDAPRRQGEGIRHAEWGPSRAPGRDAAGPAWCRARPAWERRAWWMSSGSSIAARGKRALHQRQVLLGRKQDPLRPLQGRHERLPEDVQAVRRGEAAINPKKHTGKGGRPGRDTPAPQPPHEGDPGRVPAPGGAGAGPGKQAVPHGRQRLLHEPERRRGVAGHPA